MLAALPFAANEVDKTGVLLPCDDWEDIDPYADLYRPKFCIPLSGGFCNALTATGKLIIYAFGSFF